MRKLIFTAILFISMGTMAIAQDANTSRTRKTPEEKAQQLTNTLEKKLTLTADQKSKIYIISLDGMKQMKQNQVKGERPDREVMKAEMEKRDEQISKVLTEDQRKIYQDWKLEKMKSMKDNRKGNRKMNPDKV
jgi:protein CpxP